MTVTFCHSINRVARAGFEFNRPVSTAQVNAAGKHAISLRTCVGASAARVSRNFTMVVRLEAKKTTLNLSFMQEHYHSLANVAVDKHPSHIDYLGELASSGVAARISSQLSR